MANQPPIYVINMGQDLERLKSMSTQMNAAGLTFERIEAVDGRSLSADDRKKLYSDSWCHLFHGRSAGDGEIGVGLSHRKIYKKMVDEAIEWAVIFEDDVALLPYFSEYLAEIESSTRDFDMVQLFSFRQPERELRSAPSGRFEIKTYHNLHASAAAYLMRLPGAKKLMRLPRMRVLADRWCWMSVMTGLKCCAIIPFPIALDKKLSLNSSVSSVGAETSTPSKSKRLGKNIWRLLVLPWLNFVKLLMLRSRGL